MCYNSLLGLRGCGSEEPTTGLYIDSLGINTTFLGQVITDNYAQGLDLFNDKLAFAWRKVSSDVLSYMNAAMKANTIIEGKRIGHVLNDTNNVLTALGAGNYAGIRVKLDSTQQSFLSFYLSDLIVNSSGATEVLVFDMITNKLLTTLSIVDGEVEQFIGETFKANRKRLDLAFVYESVNDSLKTVAKIGGCYDCGGRLKMMNICPFIQATGITLTTDGSSVLTSEPNKYTYGLSFNYNINCDREAWLCSIGGVMSMALAYATAVEIYDFTLMTSPTQRVNTTVSINAEQIKQARDIAAQRYTEELTAMLQNMRVPEDSNCFECKTNLKYGTMLP